MLTRSQCQQNLEPAGQGIVIDSVASSIPVTSLHRIGGIRGSCG